MNDPRTLISDLAADIDRLMAAGAGSINGDEGLRRRETALRELGKKVPALGKLADLVGQAVGASPRQAPRALLDLLVVVGQARAGLATAGVSGPIEPVEPSGPWSSPSPALDLYPLASVLSGSGSGRIAAVKDAVGRGAIGDLRFFDDLLDNLDSQNTELADAVATLALPAIGRAALPDLRNRLDLQGKAADARLLKAIAAIDPEEGLALCRKAIAEGSTATKVQALEILAEIVPDEATTTALDILSGLGRAEPEGKTAKGKTRKSTSRAKLDRHLRDAALECLRNSTRDEVLEILISALHEEGDNGAIGHPASHRYLPRLPHPKATERLLGDLERIATASQDAWQNGPKGKGGADAKTRAEAVEGQVGCLLTILGERGDRAAVPALMGLLDHPSRCLRYNAADALAELDDPAGREAVSARVDDPDLWKPAVKAAWKLPAGPRYERLGAVCGLLSSSRKTERERGEFLMELFEEEFDEEDRRSDWDPRWAEALRPNLDGPHAINIARALELVLGAGAVADLLRALNDPRLGKGNHWDVVAIIRALGRHRVREAVVPLVRMYGDSYNLRDDCGEALRQIADPSAIPLLQERSKRKKDFEKAQYQTLIDALTELTSRS